MRETPQVWVRNLYQARDYATEATEGFGFGAEGESGH